MQAVVRALAALQGLRARGLKLTRREQAHLGAVEALANGAMRVAAIHWESVLQDFPTDIVTVRLLHDLYFLLGDSRNLRDSPARVFQAWDPTMPGYGRLCGMLAFGFVAALRGSRGSSIIAV